MLKSNRIINVQSMIHKKVVPWVDGPVAHNFLFLYDNLMANNFLKKLNSEQFTRQRIVFNKFYLFKETIHSHSIFHTFVYIFPAILLVNVWGNLKAQLDAF